MKNKQLELKLRINGVMTTVKLPNGLRPVHGTGLDGQPVKSLQIGESPEHPGMLFVQDAHGNNSVTTASELFVATQHAAPRHKITAIKRA